MALEIGSRSVLLSLQLSACLTGYFLGARLAERMLMCSAGEAQPVAIRNNLGLAPLL